MTFFLEHFLMKKFLRTHIEVLTNLQDFYSQKTEKISPNFRYCKRFNFFRNYLIHKASLDLYCSLLTMLSINFHQRPGKIQPSIQKRVKNFFQGILFHNIFPWHVESSSDEHLVNKISVNFRPVYEGEEKQCFSKTFFWWIVPLDTKNTVLITLRENFSP